MLCASGHGVCYLQQCVRMLQHKILIVTLTEQTNSNWHAGAGQKKAREMWFLARLYTAADALSMGLVNKVVPLHDLETETLVW